jgi:hypothetical protein
MTYRLTLQIKDDSLSVVHFDNTGPYKEEGMKSFLVDRSFKEEVTKWLEECGVEVNSETMLILQSTIKAFFQILHCTDKEAWQEEWNIVESFSDETEAFLKGLGDAPLQMSDLSE